MYYILFLVLFVLFCRLCGNSILHPYLTRINMQKKKQHEHEGTFPLPAHKLPSLTWSSRGHWEHDKSINFIENKIEVSRTSFHDVFLKLTQVNRKTHSDPNTVDTWIWTSNFFHFQGIGRFRSIVILPATNSPHSQRVHPFNYDSAHPNIVFPRYFCGANASSLPMLHYSYLKY